MIILMRKMSVTVRTEINGFDDDNCAADFDEFLFSVFCLAGTGTVKYQRCPITVMCVSDTMILMLMMAKCVLRTTT